MGRRKAVDWKGKRQACYKRNPFLLQRKSPLFSTEISTLFSGEIFFSPRRNHLGWLQRERHEVKRPKSGTISSVPSSLTDLIKLSLSCRNALIDNHFSPLDFFSNKE